MNDSTKRRLENAGRIFMGIVEAGANTMQKNAERNARDKRKSDEYRDRYSEIASGFGELKQAAHDYKEHIGQNHDEDYEDDDYVYNDYEDENNDAIEPRRIDYKKNYVNAEKANQQATNATITSRVDISVKEHWIKLGYLKAIKHDVLLENNVGIIRLLLNNEVVYIVRAIELSNGGISRKIDDLKNNAKNGRIGCLKINKYIDEIEVECLCVGNDETAVINSRKMEKILIQKYDPIWLRKEVLLYGVEN